MNTINDIFEVTYTFDADHQTDELRKADYKTVQSRVMHERFFRTTIASGEHTLVGPAEIIATGKLYEAAKTMVYICYLLASRYRILDLTVTVDPASKYASISCATNDLFTDYPTRSINRVPVRSVITIMYIAADDTPYFDIVVNKNQLGSNIYELRKYPVHDSVIVAYDLNFPAPSQFLYDFDKMIDELNNLTTEVKFT